MNEVDREALRARWISGGMSYAEFEQALNAAAIAEYVPPVEPLPEDYSARDVPKGAQYDLTKETK